MKAHIETACFLNSGRTTLIQASNKDAAWIKDLKDIRECFGPLFTKESGDSILLLKPVASGIVLIVSKIMPNSSGDNLTAYLYLPVGLKISGDELFGMFLDIMSLLAQNNHDVVSNCLNEISLKEFEVEAIGAFKWAAPTEKFAYRTVSGNFSTIGFSVSDVLSNPFQSYYVKFEYIYIAIDNQFIANVNQHTDLSSQPISQRNEDMEIDSTNEVEITSEFLKQNTKISGWLAFFIGAVTVGGLFSVIYPIATFNIEDYAGNYCLAAVDIINGISLLLVAILTAYSFVNRKPTAVFWAKVYVSLVLLINLILLISGNEEGTGLESGTQGIRGVLFAVLWFLYLSFSNQVNEIIPKPFRKIKLKNWVIVGCMILVPIFLSIVGYSQITSLVDYRNTQEIELLATSLDENDRTDGKIIFSIPSGFSCEDKIVDSEGASLKIFQLENSNIASCTLCSVYDPDKSDTNFDSYWSGWKDEDYGSYNENVIAFDSCEINGNYCKYKITRLDVNGSNVYWSYYLLYNEPSEKLLIVSCYDGDNSTDYIDELLNSIKFN